MKVAATTLPDLARLKDQQFAHSVDYLALELEYKREAYGRLFERYQQLMRMHEHGITVTVTMTSAVGTMTIEDDSLFEPMDYLQKVGESMQRLAAEIFKLLEQKQAGEFEGTTDGQREHMALGRQALALCLPQPSALALSLPQPTATTQAA